MTEQPPPGYKKTGIGIIPEDWEVKRFKDISTVNQGLQIPISKRLKMKKGKSKIYITLQLLAGSKEVEYIESPPRSVCCNKEDVLLTRTGNTGMVVTNVEGVFHNNFFKINFDRKKIVKDYLIYYLQLPTVQKIILEKAGTSTIPDLNHNDFYSIEILLPPTLEEQRTIARVLSDFDKLIESLDKLVEKKKNIKKGAMQLLLTGKKHLPEFKGEWVRKKLGEILKYEQPTNYIVKSTDYSNNGFIPVLTPGKTFILGYTDEREGVYRDVPVIIFDDFTTASKYVTIPFKVKSSAMKILKLRDNNSDLRFIYEKLQLIDYHISEGDHKRRWIAEYQNIEITIPPTPEEQQAIAQILSDMDAEIEALEKKKEKYERIKKGTMELLLTGKIRLKNYDVDGG